MDSIAAFFTEGIERLADTHYKDHNDTCGIYRSDEEAGVRQVEFISSSVIPTAVIKARCNHVFHEACLDMWLRSPFQVNRTCTTCRGVLVPSDPSEVPQTAQAYIERELQWIEAELAHYLEELRRVETERS